MFSSAGDGDWDYEAPTGISERLDDEHGVAIAHLNKIESRASSLGASSPAAGVVKMALEREGRVACVTVPDALSMQSTFLFAGLCTIAEPHVRLLLTLPIIPPSFHTSGGRRAWASRGRRQQLLNQRPSY